MAIMVVDDKMAEEFYEKGLATRMGSGEYVLCKLGEVAIATRGDGIDALLKVLGRFGLKGKVESVGVEWAWKLGTVNGNGTVPFGSGKEIGLDEVMERLLEGAEALKPGMRKAWKVLVEVGEFKPR